MATQRYASLFDLPETGKYRFHEIDLTSDNFSHLFQDASAVIHLAALTDATGSFGRRKTVETKNLAATRAVAEACTTNQVPLIFPSSTSVYGTTKARIDEDCSPQELQPQSPYAETKLREETLLANFSNSNGLRYIACRLGTIYGVSPGMRFHTAVNKFCWQATMGQPLTVWKTAMDQKRPYLDLSDSVRAICHILNNNLFDNRVYNVITLNATVRDIISEIKVHIPTLNVQLVENKIMNQMSYEVGDDHFKASGFRPKGNLEKGISDTMRLLAAVHRK